MKELKKQKVFWLYHKRQFKPLILMIILAGSTISWRNYLSSFFMIIHSFLVSFSFLHSVSLFYLSRLLILILLTSTKIFIISNFYHFYSSYISFYKFHLFKEGSYSVFDVLVLSFLCYAYKMEDEVTKMARVLWDIVG